MAQHDHAPIGRIARLAMAVQVHRVLPIRGSSISFYLLLILTKIGHATIEQSPLPIDCEC